VVITAVFYWPDTVHSCHPTNSIKSLNKEAEIA